MKAKLLVLSLAAAVLCSGLVFGMAKNQSKASVTGVVEFYGDGPFARLGLKAQDGTLYYLDAKDDAKKELEALSGHILLVDGILTGEAAPLEISGATVIKVKGWKKL